LGSSFIDINLLDTHCSGIDNSKRLVHRSKLLMAFSVSHTNFNKNAISFYS
jgi:hypothetical protein